MRLRLRLSLLAAASVVMTSIHSSRRRLPGITTIALLGAVVAGLGTSETALAAQQDIASAGPLTHIFVNDQTNCQVAHLGDPGYEFFPSGSQTGDCGTFVVVGGTLYGFAPFTGSAAGQAQPRTAFTPISQTAVLGAGTSGDPFRVVTVVAAGTSHITLTETDSYVVGQEDYRTDVQIANTGSAAQSVRLYRAGDCFLGGVGGPGTGNDEGFGLQGSPAGAIACRGATATSPPTPATRIEQWVPITGGSRFYETVYSTGWAWIATQQAFPNTCDCSTFEDNWAGLSWDATVAAASSTTISHLTVFSPLGITPLATTKTADSATAPAGTADGYTITVTNSNVFPVALSSIFDDLPAGFSYTLGSTTGVTTLDPVVTGTVAAGLHLVWTGPFSVAASGSVSLHFNVTVSTAPGIYLNSAGGDAGNVSVAPTGPTASVTVTQSEQPITAAGVSISATEGQLFAGGVATFSDPDPNATAADYAATIDWGDGTLPTSPGTVSGPTGGPFTVSGSHTYADEGTYTVLVTITDSDSPNTATASSTATVADATLTAGALSLTGGTEGSAATTASFTFSDANPGSTTADFTSTISWGDTTSSAGTVTGPTGGPYTVTGLHTYAEEGPYTVTVSVKDDGGSSTSATGTANVADAALTASPACSTNSLQSYNGPTATFTDAASPLGTLSDFSATIDWGDATAPTAGTVTGPDGGPYVVSGSHTYAATGNFTITTTINDVGGSTAVTSCSSLTFSFAPGGGSFVIGDHNAGIGSSVTFWGAQWANLNSLSGGNAPRSFKGFSEKPLTPACGIDWSADPGNSSPPPQGPLPKFMGVIVTSSASKQGSAISGNTVHIVIVQTNPGYAPNPGHAGTGTVVAVVC